MSRQRTEVHNNVNPAMKRHLRSLSGSIEGLCPLIATTRWSAAGGWMNWGDWSDGDLWRAMRQLQATATIPHGGRQSSYSACTANRAVKKRETHVETSIVVKHMISLRGQNIIIWTSRLHYPTWPRDLPPTSHRQCGWNNKWFNGWFRFHYFFFFIILRARVVRSISIIQS